MKVKHPRIRRPAQRVISTQIDVEHADALQRLANENGLHMSQVFRRILLGEMPPLQKDPRP